MMNFISRHKDKITIGSFCIVLFGCLALSISLVYAMLAGLVIFWAYSLGMGFRLQQVFRMSLDGIMTAKKILLTFILIGILTGLWRASGTIAYIVTVAMDFIQPEIFLFMIFLLNAIVSVLTGTSFGTAATMGVISINLANILQLDPVLAGGAMVSGIYFGDRASPVSTSALLVSTLTKTDIYANLKNMFRSCIVPTLATSAVYLAGGFLCGTGSAGSVTGNIFGDEFQLQPVCIIPALVIILLSLFRVNVCYTMLTSIVAAFAVGLLTQGRTCGELFQFLATGFVATNEELAPMINGGGITSMLRVSVIVCIASAYAGIFAKTGLLNGLSSLVLRIGQRCGDAVAMAITSIVTGMLSCNQTLTIMLTHQLTVGMKLPESQQALYLEDTAVVIAPLVPWSIAVATPLAATGSPDASVLAACYLYLLPLWAIISPAGKNHH